MKNLSSFATWNFENTIFEFCYATTCLLFTIVIDLLELLLLTDFILPWGKIPIRSREGLHPYNSSIDSVFMTQRFTLDSFSTNILW